MDHMLVLGMTVKFVDRDSTLLKMLLLNRSCHEMLRDEILKQALLRSTPEKLSRKRANLWLKILQIDTNFVQNEYLIYR